MQETLFVRTNQADGCCTAPQSARPRHKGSIGQSRHYGRVPLASGLHPTPDISLRRNNALCHQRKSRGYWITRRRERPSCGNCAHNFSLGKTPSNRLKSNGIWSTEIRTTLAATGLTIRFSLGLAAILASGLRITPEGDLWRDRKSFRAGR